MFNWSNNLLMFLCGTPFFALSSEPPSPLDVHTCQSYFHVCNDFEIARQCQSLTWCETQGAACGAVDLLRKGTRGLFGAAADAVDLLCDNQFLAFRRPPKKFVKISFEMEDNQPPFSVRFDFDGSKFTLAEHAEKKGEITINDKIVYDKPYSVVSTSN